jgi:hypothetical protein
MRLEIANAAFLTCIMEAGIGGENKQATCLVTPANHILAHHMRMRNEVVNVRVTNLHNGSRHRWRRQVGDGLCHANQSHPCTPQPRSI